MKPATYTPPLLYPADTAPDNVPAFCVERPAERRVVLWHIAQDPTHPNVQATIARYQRRGWTPMTVLDRATLRTWAERTVDVPRRAA